MFHCHIFNFTFSNPFRVFGRRQNIMKSNSQFRQGIAAKSLTNNKRILSLSLYQGVKRRRMSSPSMSFTPNSENTQANMSPTKELSATGNCMFRSLCSCSQHDYKYIPILVIISVFFYLLPLLSMRCDRTMTLSTD